MSEVRVVDLKELGVSKEVFDKIYSMGEQDGKEDAIEEIIEKFSIPSNSGLEREIHLDVRELKQLKEQSK